MICFTVRMCAATPVGAGVATHFVPMNFPHATDYTTIAGVWPRPLAGTSTGDEVSSRDSRVDLHPINLS